MGWLPEVGFDQDGGVVSLPKADRGVDASWYCGAWTGSPWSLSNLVDQCKHILYTLLPFSYNAQVVVTHSYITRDSECHSTSLSLVVLPWLSPLRRGNVLYLVSYVFSWVLSQDGAEDRSSSAEKQSPSTISRIPYIHFFFWLMALGF